MESLLFAFLSIRKRLGFKSGGLFRKSMARAQSFTTRRSKTEPEMMACMALQDSGLESYALDKLSLEDEQGPPAMEFPTAEVVYSMSL